MSLMPTTKPTVPTVIAEVVAERAAEIDAGPPLRWSVDSLRSDRFFDTAPLPIEYLIDGLLVKGIYGYVYGPGESGKSLAVLSLLLQASVATRFPSQWLGKFSLTKSSKCLYICLEEIENQFHDRLHSIRTAFCDRNGFDVEEVSAAGKENLFIMTRENFFLDCPKTLMQNGTPEDRKTSDLIASTRAVGADLVIIDTRSRAVSNDENCNKSSAAEGALYERLRDESGASAVLVVGHTNKMSRATGSDAGKVALRGASAAMDNSRFDLFFSPKGEDQIRVEVTKNSYGKKPPPFICNLIYPELVFDADADASTESDQGNEDLVPRLVQWVAEHPGVTRKDAGNRDDLKKLLGIGDNKIKKVHAEAERLRLIEGIRKGHNVAYQVAERRMDE